MSMGLKSYVSWPRELLLAHPRVTDDPARVRFVSFGAHSLDLEVFAYINTSNLGEFLAIQEDIFLRMIDVVTESGTGFAFPSQVHYLAQDKGVDAERAHAAAAVVEQWRSQSRLPFPEFEPGYCLKLQNTLDYPPAGSPDANTKTPVTEHPAP